MGYSEGGFRHKRKQIIKNEKEEIGERGAATAHCAQRAQIQNSKFKIQNYKSGSSLRRTQRRKGVAGLRPAEAAARTAFARPISTRGKPAAERRGLHERTCGREHGPPQGRFLPETSPQPSGRACNEQREIAALRPGAAAGCSAPKGAMKNEELKMKNYFRAAACGRRQRCEDAAGLRAPRLRPALSIAPAPNAPRASFRRCPRRPPTARAASRPPPSPR